MIKMVPTLSERELKQLVSTIVRRRRREEGAKSIRPSEPASGRGDTTSPSYPLPTPEASTNTTRSVPKGQRSKPDDVEAKTLEDTRGAERPDLAGALLRQASRKCCTSRYILTYQVCHLRNYDYYDFKHFYDRLTFSTTFF